MSKQEKAAGKELQACLTIKDDGEAFACVKKMVTGYPKGEGPRLVLLVSADCEPCEEEAVVHKKDIDKGIIEVIDFASDEGILITEKNDISLTPALILLDQDNKLIDAA